MKKKTKRGNRKIASFSFTAKMGVYNRLDNHTCIKDVDGQKKCKYCTSNCVRNGKNTYQEQRFLCRTCGRSFTERYKYQAYNPSIDSQIKSFVKEGCVIRGIARLLHISTNTVLKKIKAIAFALQKPAVALFREYELDELCTFIGSKKEQVWITYAIRKDTRAVADFTIGNRSNTVLSRITSKLLAASATRIYTDRLLQYKSLIPSLIHCTKKNGINHIERKNLTLRTHLKRLNRRTICFSRSMEMLHACLLIYFFS